MYKFFFVCCGHVSLATGIIGVFLPILPTTPFVLLACGCYAKGSEKFHAGLIHSKWFGPLIKDWHEHKAIPISAKVTAILMITASMIWTIMVVPFLSVKIGLVVLGITITSYILTRPSLKKF